MAGGGHRGAHGGGFGARESSPATGRISSAKRFRAPGRDGSQGRGRALQPAGRTGSHRPATNRRTGMSSPGLQIADTLFAASSATLQRATDYLLSRRTGEGYWWGELTA